MILSTLGTYLSPLTQAMQFAKYVVKGANAVNSHQATLESRSRPARVEPFCLVEDALVSNPLTQEVCQHLNTLFAGYYLQAVNLTVPVNRIDVVKLLDQFNPDRNPEKGYIQSGVEHALTRLSYGDHELAKEELFTMFDLPDGDDPQSKTDYPALLKVMVQDDQASAEALTQDLDMQAFFDSAKKYFSRGQGTFGPTRSPFDVEAARVSDAVTGQNVDRTVFPRGNSPEAINRRRDLNQQVNNTAGAQSRSNSEFARAVKDVPSLATGIVLDVHIRDGNAAANIPVTVRLLVNEMPKYTILHLLENAATNKDMTERYWTFKEGAPLVRDIIFMQDLVDQHRRAILQDKTGMAQSLLARRRRNEAAGAITGSPSIGACSNIIVLSKTSADEFARQTGQNLKDAQTRRRIFEGMYGMFIAVVDTMHNVVTVYVNGQDQGTVLNRAALAQSSRDKKPDVLEIMKQFGMTPRSL